MRMKNPIVIVVNQKSKKLPENLNAFVVFWSSLLLLLIKRCLMCPASAFIESIYYKGPMLIVSLICEKGHCKTGTRNGIG